MCFVSYIPLQDGFLLGSNRDEYAARIPARPPRVENRDTGRLLLPRDGKAGGTWIAVREDGVGAVLLNGAREAHKPQPPYRRSRGALIPDLMAMDDPLVGLVHLDCEGLEPFTLLVAAVGRLTELVWNGAALEMNSLYAGEPACWSSATLYNPYQQGIRTGWFTNAIQQGLLQSGEALLNWHGTGGYGPADMDIRLLRNGGLLTVSTTVVQVGANDISMLYTDYLRPAPEQDTPVRVYSFTGREK